LRRLAAKRRIGLIAGMCSDKDARGFLSAFGGTVERLWAVPLRNERGMPPDALRTIGEALGWQSESTDLPRAVGSVVEWASDCGGVACIAGSLYLVGEVLELEEE
jgi:folylpolyglutamate synthase/dihydropteroate synthase